MHNKYIVNSLLFFFFVYYIRIIIIIFRNDNDNSITTTLRSCDFKIIFFFYYTVFFYIKFRRNIAGDIFINDMCIPKQCRNFLYTSFIITRGQIYEFKTKLHPLSISLCNIREKTLLNQYKLLVSSVRFVTTRVRNRFLLYVRWYE